ncbi:MAG: hypothetical protein ACYDG2_14265 [Ruminiclostridium sp.]
MEIIDNNIFEIIDGEITYLLNGRKTAQQVANEINLKVTLFLNE